MIYMWKDVDPEGYSAAKEAMSSWIHKRFKELHMANLEQLSEDIKNGEKLPKGAASSTDTTESNEHS